MPRMDGREVFERIAKIRPDLRILFSSGYSAGAIGAEIFQIHGIRLIQKPYTADVLLREVRAVLDAPTPRATRG